MKEKISLIIISWLMIIVGSLGLIIYWWWVFFCKDWWLMKPPLYQISHISLLEFLSFILSPVLLIISGFGVKSSKKWSLITFGLAFGMFLIFPLFEVVFYLSLGSGEGSLFPMVACVLIVSLILIPLFPYLRKKLNY